MVPPNEPADSIITSIIIGNASASPARDSVPSRPTNHASAISVTMVTTMAIMLGAASRMIVGPIGAVSNGDAVAVVMLRR
jgi:hypothetical protein